MQTKSQENNNELTVLCGSAAEYTGKPLPPFDNQVLEFLNAVSRELMRDREAKAYPDIVTFAFFCRRANLEQLARAYAGKISGRVGRGLAFHIAPSNVPINFAYSLVSALLAGNASIVKASSRDFIQTRITCRAFQKALEEYPEMKPYINVVMYDRDRQEITEAFSSVCNARIIWGGDRTIAAVKAAPIPPRAIDVAFADRYSLSVIRSASILEIQDDGAKRKRLAQDFYNDTYLYDQNACTSPRLIIWLGSEADSAKAREIFWQDVYENIAPRYQMEAETAVDKLMAADRTAIAIPGSRIVKHTKNGIVAAKKPGEGVDSVNVRPVQNCTINAVQNGTQDGVPGSVQGVKSAGNADNRIVCVEIPRLTPNLPDLRAAEGFFHEYISMDLEALAPIVTEKYQTLSYFGCNPQKLRDFVTGHGLRGIDRIVPIGHTADWSLTWDGYDLITTLSREIAVV